MSLYYEAAAILENKQQTGGSLKSRIFNTARTSNSPRPAAGAGSKTKVGDKGARTQKSTPAQLYALIIETTRWSTVLSEVIEKAQLLDLERKLTPCLSLLLTHDLLLAKKGIQAPSQHVLTLTMKKHQARLSSEFQRMRIKGRYADLEAFKMAVESGGSTSAADVDGEKVYEHPRWVRVNPLRQQTQLNDQAHPFVDYLQAKSLKEITDPQSTTHTKGLYWKDEHIPDLYALNRHINIVNSEHYKSGQIIIQDKASCFPAYLLDPATSQGDIIDATAAPGNKTTHLAALLSTSKHVSARPRKVFAFERDKGRSKILGTMVTKAGGHDVINILGNTDFLSVKPTDERFKRVEALLLDPSCSGSGIVGRDDGPVLTLPKSRVAVVPVPKINAAEGDGGGTKKRKRGAQDIQQASVKPEPVGSQIGDGQEESDVEETPITETCEEKLQARLQQLAAFQLRILTHAMKFPAAMRITYSTCSVHFIENEGVVLSALQSDVAVERGWRVLPRSKQVDGMRRWHVRGDGAACWEWREKQKQKQKHQGDLSTMDMDQIVDACIRCDKGTVDGTMGFFVAAFERDGSSTIPGDTTAAQSKATNGRKAANPPTERIEEHVDPSESEEDEWGGFDD